jgi:hypothetical protein
MSRPDSSNSSKDNSSGLAKSQTRIVGKYKAVQAVKPKMALPKGPFHYRNESKKITQI